jgi:protein-S-isoprenylcysteine O-methyltransferase Ste14
VIASDFEYRHRFWMIVLVYVATYALYNVDHLNILYSIVPWNQGVARQDFFVLALYASAAVLAAVGAALLTWATAYRPPNARGDRTPFSTGGPFRYVRNPHYLSYFLLVLALGTFQSRLGFPLMLLGESILLMRLVAREERHLEQEYGERFCSYAKHVPRLLPALSPRPARDAQQPHWRRALWNQAFQWGFVATLAAFAFTLSDPVGYAFAYATLGFLLLQKLTTIIWTRPRRT